MKERNPHALRGVACSALGGVCWGFSGTCVRLLAGGILLTVPAVLRRRESVKGIFRGPKDLLRLICYGICGLLLCQYAYMTAISYSNAATITVLQNLGLLIVMGYTCLRGRRLPSRREGAALVLALAGVYLLATGGDPGHMALSTKGLFWGLAAVAVALYTLLPQSLLSRWDRDAVIGPGILIGGIFLNLTARSWTFSFSLPFQGWLAVGAVVLLGTAVAFSIIMRGMVDVGPAKASMLASTEPVSATVFSALWLGTSFSATDLIGFAAITATVFLLAKSE